jgi:hypothetical protein
MDTATKDSLRKTWTPRLSSPRGLRGADRPEHHCTPKTGKTRGTEESVTKTRAKLPLNSIGSKQGAAMKLPKYALGHMLSTLKNCPEDKHWPMSVSKEEHQKMIEETYIRHATGWNFQRFRCRHCRRYENYAFCNLILASLRCTRCGNMMNEATPKKYRDLFNRKPLSFEEGRRLAQRDMRRRERLRPA